LDGLAPGVTFFGPFADCWLLISAAGDRRIDPGGVTSNADQGKYVDATVTNG
jgi:hypothetical protein